jgi:hypothetical protein
MKTKWHVWLMIVRERISVSMVVFLSLFLAAPLAAETSSGLTLVTAGRLLDPKTGNILSPAGVLIENGKIKEVGSPSQLRAHAPPGTKAIDLGSASLLPGLIDSHTHLLLDVTLPTEEESSRRYNSDFASGLLLAIAGMSAGGLLDGLSATTTAGNIIRLRQSYPKIKVVNDRRVVDNGKILTTAGLSAGIDGALDVVAALDGEAAAQSVALAMELDWHHQGGYVRGTMADRLIPDADFSAFGESVASRRNGDNDRWEKTMWLKSRISAAELFGRIQSAYEKAYAKDGSWSPGSFCMASSGPLSAGLRFDHSDGHHWQGALTVEPAGAGADQFMVRLVTARAD